MYWEIFGVIFISFMRNTLAYVEKSCLGLIQSDLLTLALVCNFYLLRLFIILSNIVQGFKAR